MSEPSKSNWTDRLLGLCVIGIAVLWVGGVTRFRDVELQAIEWLTLVAAGFTMQMLTQRVWQKRPLPPLPEGSRAIPLAGLVAAVVGVMAAVLGGILELIVQNYLPSDSPWGLRMLWHAACAFGASYCAFLRRLLRVLPA